MKGNVRLIPPWDIVLWAFSEAIDDVRNSKSMYTIDNCLEESHFDHMNLWKDMIVGTSWNIYWNSFMDQIFQRNRLLLTI